MSQFWGNMLPEEFEGLSSAWSPMEFEHLCICLIAADFPFASPVFSGRSNTADGGFDALLRVEESLQFRALASPGLNIYEVKWRSPIHENSLKNLKSKGKDAPLHQKLKKVREKMGEPLVLRVFVNLNLSKSEQDALLALIEEGCDCPQSKAELVDAGRIALQLNLHAHLRAACRPGESVQSHASWKDDILRRTRNQGGPQSDCFVGRSAELKQLREALLDPKRRVFRVSGEPGIGKTRFVAEAISNSLSRQTVVALDEKVFEGSAWTQLRRQEILLILDEPSEPFERMAIEQVLSTEGIRLLIISRRISPGQTSSLEIVLRGLEPEAAWDLCNHLPRKDGQWDTGWLVGQLNGNPALLIAAAQQMLEPQPDLPSYVQELAKQRARTIPDRETYAVAQRHALSPRGLLLEHRIPEEFGLEPLSRRNQQEALSKLTTLGFVERQGLRFRIVPSALADYLVLEYWTEHAPDSAFNYLLHDQSEFAQDAMEALLKTVSSTSRTLAGELLKKLDIVEMVESSYRLAGALLEHQADVMSQRLSQLSAAESSRLGLPFVRKMLSIPHTAWVGLAFLRERVCSSEPWDKTVRESYYLLFHPQWPQVALSLDDRQKELDALRGQDGPNANHYWEALNGMLGDRRMMSMGFESRARPIESREFTSTQIRNYLNTNIARALQDVETSQAEPDLLIRFAENLYDRGFRQEALALYGSLASRRLSAGTKLVSSLSLRAKWDETGRGDWIGLRESIFQREPVQELLWWTEIWPRVENQGDDEVLSERRRERFEQLGEFFVKDGTLPNFEKCGSRLFGLQDFFQTLGRLDEGLRLAESLPDKVAEYYWEGVAKRPSGQRKTLEKLSNPEVSPAQRYRIACRLSPALVSPALMLEIATDSGLAQHDFERVLLYGWSKDLPPEALIDFLEALVRSQRNQSARLADEFVDALNREELTSEQREAIFELSRPTLEHLFRPQQENDNPDFAFVNLFHTTLKRNPELVCDIYVSVVFASPEPDEDSQLLLYRATRGYYFRELCASHPQPLLYALVRRILHHPPKDWTLFTFGLRDHFNASQLRELWATFADKSKDKAALLARFAQGGDDNFWLLAQDLMEPWGDDPDVRGLLFQAAIFFGTTWYGPESEQLGRVKSRFTHPAGKEYLSAQTLSFIEAMGEQLERRITGRIVWEYDLTSEEFRQMLDSRDDQKRRWAYLRVLRQVKPQEWNQWLDWRSLRVELPKLPLEEREKANIHGLVEYLSG